LLTAATPASWPTGPATACASCRRSWNTATTAAALCMWWLHRLSVVVVAYGFFAPVVRSADVDELALASARADACC